MEVGDAEIIEEAVEQQNVAPKLPHQSPISRNDTWQSALNDKFLT